MMYLFFSPIQHYRTVFRLMIEMAWMMIIKMNIVKCVVWLQNLHNLNEMTKVENGHEMHPHTLFTHPTHNANSNNNNNNHN